MPLDQNDIAMALGHLIIDKLDIAKRLEEANKKLKSLGHETESRKPEDPPSAN